MEQFNIRAWSNDWVEIKQGEYRKLKREQPKTVHSFTARIGHRYFKTKTEHPLVQEFDKLLHKIFLDNVTLLDKINFRDKLVRVLK